MKPVRGTYDLVGENYKKYKKIEQIFVEHVQLYNFKGIQSPILEHAEIYTSTAGITADIIKEMYTVKSMSAMDDTSTTVLRPEGTASCIRAMIAAGNIDNQRSRLYYCEKMFRYNRPQKGRFREFIQLGCEILNTLSIYDDIELIQCLTEFLNKLNVKYKLHINSIGSQESLKKYSSVLYAFFKKNISILTDLNKSRLETNVMRLLDQLNEDEKNQIGPDFPNIINYLSFEEKSRFESICRLLDELQISYYLDPYLVRGLDYYQHTVFEVVQSNQAIAGGGCYLFNRSKFGAGNGSINGLGWGIGLERLASIATVDIFEDDLYLIYADRAVIPLLIANKLRANKKKCMILECSINDCFKRAAALNAKYIVFPQNENLVRLRTRNSDIIIDINEL